MPTHKRGPWSQQEDDLLLALVDQYGASNWVRISSTIQTRSPKQCRERFHQNLKPNLNHDPISPEEGVLIEQMVAEMGKRWAEIARRLRGRSDNAVKNWWNGGMNRRRRNQQQRQAEVQIRHHYHPHAHHTVHPPMHSLPMQQPLPGGAFAPHYIFPQTQYIGQPQQHYAHFPVATFGRMVEAPLPSPSAFSQVSADGAPSLVSDRSSLDNRSPRHGPSPNPVELPPLAGSREERRTSAPLLRLGVPGAFAQDTDFALQGFESFGEMRKPVLQEPFMPHTMPQSTSLPVPTAYLPSQPRQPSPYPSAQQMQQGYVMTGPHVQHRHAGFPMSVHVPTTPMSQHHNLSHDKYHQYGSHIDSGMGTPIISGHSPEESPKAKISISNLTHSTTAH